jgi:hypothetical protein
MQVTYADVIAWRRDFEARELSPAHPSQAPDLSSLFYYPCERNAVSGNPVDGVKRPMANSRNDRIGYVSSKPRPATRRSLQPLHYTSHLIWGDPNAEGKNGNSD